LIFSSILFVGGTFALTFGSYFLMRYVLGEHRVLESQDLASSTAFRMAALLGLMLALVFSQELSNLNKLNQTIGREANKLESVFHDLKQYGGPEATELQRDIALYVHEVIEVEWPLLDVNKQLSPNADQLWAKLYDSILNLPAPDDRQRWLRNRMLTQISEVGDERSTREIVALTDVNPAFWVITFVGISAIAASFLAFPPVFGNMILLTIYAGYVGTVLFFINSFDYPFSEFGGAQPVALQILFDHYLRPLVPPGSAQG